jgi:hypothetical protein
VDHVLGALPAKVTGALLAQTPANGVDDIALSASVGTDKGGDAGWKLERGGPGKTLESGELEGLQEQTRLRLGVVSHRL